jgi:S1-C subfamily serine protease
MLMRLPKSARALPLLGRCALSVALLSLVACSSTPPSSPTPDPTQAALAAELERFRATATAGAQPVSAATANTAPTVTIQATAAPTTLSQEDAVALVKQYTVLIVTDKGFGSGSSLGKGDVLTAWHVVEGAARIEVRFTSGHRESVQLIGGDARRDLALLRSSFKEEPAAPIGDATTLRQGASLLAVGYPRPTAIGTEDVTATRGVFSARRASDEGVWHVQTDTTFNPGNSGGPLADSQGKLVGVVTFGIRGATGLNFAVASDEVNAFLASPMQVPLARPAPQPTPVSPTPAPPISAPAASRTLPDLEAVLRSFYSAVTQRRYRDAYVFYSRSAQTRESYAAFERRFEQADNTTDVRFIDNVSRQASSASLSAHTLTVQRVVGKRECWRVDWQLVSEDGQWKRESAAQYSEPC